MTDPKNKSDDNSADKTSAEDAAVIEAAAVIDVEPTRVSNNHNAPEDHSIPEDDNDDAATKRSLSRRMSLRTKLIGVLILLIIITGTVATMLYPLWRDRADALMSQAGLSLSLPAVPDNGFYRTVGVVIAFLEGTSPDTAPGETDTSPAAEKTPISDPAPDPLAILAGRLEDMETKVSRLAETTRAALSTADRAAAASTARSDTHAEALADLVTRFDRLEQRLDRLEALSRANTAQGGSEAAAVSEAQQNLIGSLQERIVSLESRERSAAPVIESITREIEAAKSGADERISSLEEDLATVRQLTEKGAPQRERAALLLLAVGQLEAATSTSGSFTAQLASVRDMAAAETGRTADAIAVLTAHEGGVETVASLTQRFNALAKAVTQAKLAGSDEGLVGKVFNRVASLVTIRRTDIVEGPSIDAILVRAESALQAGNVVGAVTALEELSGAPAERASDWLNAAKARLTVDQAVADLRSIALASVAEAG